MTVDNLHVELFEIFTVGFHFVNVPDALNLSLTYDCYFVADTLHDIDDVTAENTMLPLRACSFMHSFTW